MKQVEMLIRSRGYEVWAKWDSEAEIFELFAERECEAYVGCADTKGEAKAIAQNWINEQFC